MKKTVIVILFICYELNNIYAQTPQEMIDSFFKIYEKSEPSKALDDLYSHAPWLKGKNENVENLKIKFDGLKSNVGEYHGYELLNEKNIKTTFIIYTYLVKFENNPITFTFEFYKPNKDWTVYSFAYDYNFVGDLEKCVKDELFEIKK